MPVVVSADAVTVVPGVVLDPVDSVVASDVWVVTTPSIDVTEVVVLDVIPSEVVLCELVVGLATTRRLSVFVVLSVVTIVPVVCVLPVETGDVVDPVVAVFEVVTPDETVVVSATVLEDVVETGREQLSSILQRVQESERYKLTRLHSSIGSPKTRFK